MGNHRRVLCKRVTRYDLQFANSAWQLGGRDEGVLGGTEYGESERVGVVQVEVGAQMRRVDGDPIW